MNPSLKEEAEVQQTVAVGCSLVRAALGAPSPLTVIHLIAYLAYSQERRYFELTVSVEYRPCKVVFCGAEACDGTEPMSHCINLVLEGAITTDRINQ